MSELSDLELAATLLFLLGEPIPHSPALESKASEMIQAAGSREEILREAARLCGNQETPQQLYLCSKVYSWLGRAYSHKVIHCASEYLKTPGWDALPKNVREENGIWVDQAQESRASVYMVLASAQEMEGALSQAFSNYEEAYYLTPYNAMCTVKAAEVLKKLRSSEEALNYLKTQQSNVYYEPVLYRDDAKTIQRNELFKQLVDAHILKLSKEIKAVDKN